MADSGDSLKRGSPDTGHAGTAGTVSSVMLRQRRKLVRRAFLLLTLAIVVAESLLMLTVGRLSAPISLSLVLLDTLALLLLLLPALYFIYHRPLTRWLDEMVTAQSALRESEELFRTIVTNSQPVIFMIDQSGEFILSEGRMLASLGLKPGQVVGQSALEIYKDFPAVIFGLKTALSGKIHTDIVEVGEMHFDIFYSPYRDSRGEVAGCIGMAVDITELKHAEEERLQLERQVQHGQKLESLGLLAGGIAHDFNNLLMGILGNADLALKDLPPSSPVRDCMEGITQASRRAADLAKQMLAYSGRGKFVISAIAINNLIEEITHLLSVSLGRNVTLKFDLAQSLPVFEGDATQVRQVLMNLIINASEAVGDKVGVVKLSTGLMDCDRDYLDGTSIVRLSTLDDPPAEGSYVFLEVADTGVGMDSETLAKIFDPFYSTKFTGRGLGLAAVLGIVRSHAGSIWIESEPGQGTTLRVLFPSMGALAESPARELLLTPAEKAWRAEGKILVVDDDETVRSLARRMLERQGFSVLTVNDGLAAVQLFAERSADIACVLLDLTMPELDGEACFDELRRIDPDVRVIMSSGYNEQDVTNRFVDRGAIGFIQKPYGVDELINKLRETLSG